jgi:hypothetical protein
VAERRYYAELSCIKQECRSEFTTARRHVRLVCSHAISSNQVKEERVRIHNRILAVSSLTLGDGTGSAEKAGNALRTATLSIYCIFPHKMQANKDVENNNASKQCPKKLSAGCQKYPIAYYRANDVWNHNILKTCESRFLGNCDFKFELFGVAWLGSW